MKPQISAAGVRVYLNLTHQIAQYKIHVPVCRQRRQLSYTTDLITKIIITTANHQQVRPSDIIRYSGNMPMK